MDKHTQGEWQLNPLPNPNKPRYYCLYTKEGGPETINHIATIACAELTNKNEMHANAKLIYAAPDMLKALQMALPLLEDHAHESDNEAEDSAAYFIRKAIKKATE